MELKRILAKDSRRAIEEVSEQFGEDALVISSNKVNGQTEIIVAIDLEKNNVASKNKEETKNTDETFSDVLQQNLDASQQANAESQIHTKISANDWDREYLRAREIVDLVKTELSALRKEFKVNQQILKADTTLSLKDSLEPMSRFFEDTGLSLKLRALLFDNLNKCENLEDATVTAKRIIRENLPKKTSVGLNGTHLVVGNCGVGKTTATSELAKKAAEKNGTEQIAIISYKDSKLGAWSQVQLIGAKLGIDTYQIKEEKQLKLLVEELQSKKTLIIDSSGVDFENRAKEVENLIEELYIHLVMSWDASEYSVRNLLDNTLNVEYSSIIIARANKQLGGWALLNTVSTTEIPISYILNEKSGAISIEQYTETAILELAFAECNKYFDYGPRIKENYSKTTIINDIELKGNQMEEVDKKDQIDPKMMLSDPLLMISKLVEKQQVQQKSV